jgi:membrane-bound ClpP family serine protease
MDQSVWLAAGLVASWIITDLLLYPSMRRFYRSEPVGARMIGEQGVALSPLGPAGFVRVHGEIWQARAADERRIEEGSCIRVREIQGLLLTVTAVSS